MWTNDIRYKPGKDLIVPDLLSRPPDTPIGTAYQLDPDGESPEYIAPHLTVAALEEVALNVVSPQKIAQDQEICQDVQAHRQGLHPKGIKMKDVEIGGFKVYCEVSDSKNPRPLLPKEQRTLVLNLLHHQDHPSSKETLRRVAQEYYWPCMKTNVEAFCKTCHPCQLAKQAKTVNQLLTILDVFHYLW